MLGWSINLFRVRGILLSVHFSFLLLLGYVGTEGWIHGRWPGLWWSAATLLTFFTCVVLHELGHCLTARQFGVGVNRILLMPIGGMAEFDNIPRQPSRELLITLAGPAVNFAIAALMWFTVDLPENWEPAAVPVTGWDLVYHLFYANLVMGCFNFAPVFPMDGGRIFRALLAMKMPYVRATRWAAHVAKGLAGVAWVVIVALAALGFLPWIQAAFMIVLFGFIVVVGQIEYRATRRREIDEAKSRAIYAVYYEIPATTEEPPLLVRS